MGRLKIVFMGTPELAATVLRQLAAHPEFDLVGIITQPDRPKGRDLKLVESPVKKIGQELKLPVLQPERAREPDFIGKLKELKPDLIVVAAFGQILPQTILDLPAHGALNVHTSLLPKYRGAAPIQWAIINGETETGVTIMKMDAGMDTGDILTQEKTPIGPDETSETLHDRLAALGACLLIKTIPNHIAGKIAPRTQKASEATSAPKIKKEHGRADWNLSAVKLFNLLRGLVPWPGVFTYLPGPRPVMIKIWQATVASGQGPAGSLLHCDKNGLELACGQGSLVIHELQREGARRMSAADFLAGHPLRPGQTFLSHLEHQSVKP